MTTPPDDAARPIDVDRVRRLFGRPRVLDGDDFVPREVARRMMERMATVRVDATRVVDLGCGAGRDTAALRARFADAPIVDVDLAMPRLERLRASLATSGIARWFGRAAAPLAVQADFAALPFAARTFDVLWSNLALHWSPAPDRVLVEWARVARAGALVAFSAFGPDTLVEVAEAFGAVDARPHVMPFVDMHDYGDMLVAAGFVAPVVDMERLALTYSTPESLWADVRVLGGLATTGRTAGLAGRDVGRRLADALDRTRDASGRYRLTFELVFAHAWRGEPKTTSGGETIVRLRRDPLR